jgi:hypothetical protein
VAGTNADNPNLSVRVTGFEAIAGSNFTGIDFKGSGFEVVRAALPIGKSPQSCPHFRPRLAAEGWIHRALARVELTLLYYIGVVELP